MATRKFKTGLTFVACVIFSLNGAVPENTAGLGTLDFGNGIWEGIPDEVALETET